MCELISKELLSLVLDEEIKVFRLVELLCKHNTQSYITIHKEELYDISLDTLTRLCKEFIIKNNHTIALYSALSKKQWLMAINNNQFFADTELEAVLKATEWVAKEKGLI